MKIKRTIERHGNAPNTGRSPEYRAWESIKQRCLNPKCRSYKNWGARGIKVFPSWIHSFTKFLSHVGRRPTKSHSIHRMDNDGHYEPGNLKWATGSEQSQGRRTTVWLSVDGEKMSMKSAAQKLGVDKSAMGHFIRKKKQQEILSFIYHNALIKIL